MPVTFPLPARQVVSQVFPLKKLVDMHAKQFVFRELEHSVH